MGGVGVEGALEPVNCQAQSEQSSWLSRLSWWWEPSIAKTRTNERKEKVTNEKIFLRNNFMRPGHSCIF